MVIILPTAKRMGVALPVGSNWICHTLFFSLGTGTNPVPKMQYFVRYYFYYPLPWDSGQSPWCRWFQILPLSRPFNRSDWISHNLHAVCTVLNYIYIFFQQSTMIFLTVVKIRVVSVHLYKEMETIHLKVHWSVLLLQITSCMILKSKPQKLTFKDLRSMCSNGANMQKF